MARLLGEALCDYLAGAGAAFAFELAGLWRRWAEVVGPDLAALGRPIGHRGRTLVVAAEDAAAAQEISFLAPELLAAVNRHLGRPCFDKVQADLILGRAPLDERRAPPARSAGFAPVRPERLGGLSGTLPAASAVGRCYAAYVRLFEGRRGGKGSG